MADLSKEKGLEPLSQWVFSLHRNTRYTCKFHQSMSGSNDQGIDNIQRTIRTYSKSGSDRESGAKGP